MRKCHRILAGVYYTESIVHHALYGNLYIDNNQLLCNWISHPLKRREIILDTRNLNNPPVANEVMGSKGESTTMTLLCQY